jgi:all-beta uncharacterized protein
MGSSSMRSAAALVAPLLLCACGGSGSGTSISVSPSSVTFAASPAAASPPDQRVHVTYRGDGVLVGYPPGVAAPSWLAVSAPSTTAGSLDATLHVNSPSTPGTYSTTLRFVTGRQDGSDVKFADVPVTLTVPPPFDASAPTSIAPDQTAVTFLAAVGGPDPLAQTLAVAYNGAQVTAGFPPGTAAPSWLRVDAFQAPGTAHVRLTATGTATAGTRSATVRLGTARPDGSGAVSVDVPVTFEVYRPFAATAPALAFSAFQGAPGLADPAAGLAIDVQGDRTRWTVGSDAGWLAFGAAAGTGPATVTVTATPAGKPPGTYTATVTLADADTARVLKTFQATLTVRPLHLTVSTPATFAVDAGSTPAALTQAIAVSDELGGAGAPVSWWVASVDADWLRLAPTSGTTSPPATVTLTVDASKLPALANGARTAHVTFSYTVAQGAPQTLVAPVALSLCLPRAEHVAPYVAVAGAAGRAVVRGQGFSCPGPTPALTTGATELAKTVDADGQLRIDVPPLAAGRHPLRFANGLGLALDSAELVAVDRPAMSYQALPAPSRRARLVYDAERTRLYAANTADQLVERWAFSGATWGALATVAVPALRDVALSGDGARLAVATTGALGDLDLAAAAPSFTSRVANPDGFCSSYFAQLAPMSDGRAYAIFKLGACSGFSESYLYDPTVPSVTRATSLYNGLAAAPADGTRVYLGSNGVSPAQAIAVFDPLAGTTTSVPAVTANLFAATVSGDASRVVLQNVDVYSRALVLLGHLPANQGALASRDGTRAFVYRDDGAAGARLEVYDLAAAPQGAGALQPLVKTFALSDRPNAAAGGTVQLVGTPDDGVVFVSGDSRILVVPAR